MTKAYCSECKRETQHRHMHDCAHGIPATHMSGSERYVCVECGMFIKKDEAVGVYAHLKFILD